MYRMKAGTGAHKQSLMYDDDGTGERIRCSWKELE